MKCNCEQKDKGFALRAFIPEPKCCPIAFRLVKIPASLGDDTAVKPENGLYRNVILNYEANDHTYIYSSDGIPVLLTVEGGGAADFDSLTGRPQYGGQPMTSATNVPDLTNAIQTLNQRVDNAFVNLYIDGSLYPAYEYASDAKFYRDKAMTTPITSGDFYDIFISGAHVQLAFIVDGGEPETYQVIYSKMPAARTIQAFDSWQPMAYIHASDYDGEIKDIRILGDIDPESTNFEIYGV